MKVAIIGAGVMAKIFSKKAKEMGVETHCFAWEDGAIAKDCVDYFYPISIFDKEKIVQICREKEINGVIATTELTIAIVSYIANELGLNSNPIEISQNITNKHWVRKKIKNNKYINQPRFFHLLSINDFDKLNIFDCPVIVKPVSEGGKRGITVVQKKEELKSALDDAFRVDRQNNGVLVEEYIYGGQEYSVEGLSYNGVHQIIQITEKISSGPPHCVELGHSQPAEISKEMRSNIIMAIIELLNSVGLQNGPTHTEIKIVNGKIFLIELNARPGGDHIAYPLTQLSTGYDYISESIRVAMNIEPTRRDNTMCIKYAGVRFIAKQTENLMSVFENCDSKSWLYEKHIENIELEEISHNDCYHTNYFIYCDDIKPIFN